MPAPMEPGGLPASQAGGLPAGRPERCLLLRQYPLLGAKEIEDSPSRRDGVSATMEAAKRKMALRHVKEFVMDLKR